MWQSVQVAFSPDKSKRAVGAFIYIWQVDCTALANHTSVTYWWRWCWGREYAGPSPKNLWHRPVVGKESLFLPLKEFWNLEKDKRNKMISSLPSSASTCSYGVQLISECVNLMILDLLHMQIALRERWLRIGSLWIKPGEITCNFQSL